MRPRKYFSSSADLEGVLEKIKLKYLVSPLWIKKVPYILTLKECKGLWGLKCNIAAQDRTDYIRETSMT